MPYKEWKPEKVYYTVSETAQICGKKNTSAIRFIAEEHEIFPKRSKNFDRKFTKDEVEKLKIICEFRKWSTRELVEHVIFCHDVIKTLENKLKTL